MRLRLIASLVVSVVLVAGCGGGSKDPATADFCRQIGHLPVDVNFPMLMKDLGQMTGKEKFFAEGVWDTWITSGRLDPWPDFKAEYCG